MTKAEWLVKRTELGIGASEVATILNLNPYEDAVKLYYMKIGRYQKNIRSEKMMMGNAIEPFIKDRWCEWVPDEEEYLSNFETGKKVRSLRRVKAFTINPNYPWLFASFDYYAPKNQLDVFNFFERPDKLNPLGFPVQMKNTTINATKQWINGLPIYYYVQCQTELLVSNVPYMEFCYLQDGYHIENMPIQLDDVVTEEMREAGFDKPFVEEILERTKDFWYNRVLPAKGYVEQINKLKSKSEAANQDEINKLEQKIVELEPSPSDSECYEEFMLDLYKNTSDKIIIEGRPEHLEIALLYNMANDGEKAHKEKKQIARNRLIELMRDAERIDFGERGRIIWRRAEGKKAYFSVQVI